MKAVRGTVKSYDPQSGRGLIVLDEREDEMQVDVVISRGIRLAEGQQVEVLRVHGRDAVYASAVSVISHVRRTAMATGTVKWFNDSKGFGFITPDDQSEDIFVHFTAIQGNGFKTLAENQKVEYDVAQSPRGPQAVNVRAL